MLISYIIFKKYFFASYINVKIKNIMIINKISDKNNEKIISEKYVEWLNSGISSSQILVLTFNSNSKKNIIKNILNLSNVNILTDLKIYTFNGLIYNTISDNWSFLENKIKNADATITPNLTGLEISQYLMKQLIKEDEVKGYNSKKSLLHQLFRRYSLIVKNNLTPEEINKKSEILHESFRDDAKTIIQKLKAKTIELRAFDNIRQAEIFEYIYKNTDYFKDIKYLITEDADENTPLFFDFISKVAPQLNDKLILFDKNGGTRVGYLCAEPNSKDKLEQIFNEKIADNDEELRVKNLVSNIINGGKNPISDLYIFSLSKRVDMIEYALTKTNELIEKGIPPEDISVITPVQDKTLKHIFKSGLKDGEPIFLSGNEKLIDNPLVKAILTVLKLSKNSQMIFDKFSQNINSVDEYELRIILSKYLEIPIKNCREIIENYKNTNSLIPLNLGVYTDKFNNFCELINTLKKSNKNLSEKAYYTYTNLIKKTDKNDLAKFNFFLKELQDFEKVFKKEDRTFFEEEIITQIENSIISENPYSTLEIEKNNLVIATPQKIIDNKIKTKYQFWLDISSMEWIKSDTGPLYNSWVFQKNWNKENYTVEDNIRLSKEKTARVLRKLILNTEYVIALSSLFDTQGTENIGGIEEWLVSENDNYEKDNDSKVFKITPRDDQKPVLDYKKGKMAISAVPGAGKTTILLALIIKLIEDKINPENIYVLTYMESAARNFKDRIGATINRGKIPNISTIHGLALRILKENSNYERIGLNSDFEICDDIQKGNIIKSLCSNLTKQESDEFERAISTLKLSGGDYSVNNPKIKQISELKKGNASDMKLQKFLKFFFNYQKTLEKNNLIDYDDILISAVKLLENNKDILEYYQDICHYIIEDEAQDSSSIQQKLINLLSAKHQNLIRCGDINQAITTTFTNADTEGFKEFINSSERVNMNRSQRCSEGIWKLANSLVKYGNSKTKDAFFETYMNPVENKNPIEKKPVISKIFETPKEEKIEIIKEIKTILSASPNSTIGLLLRNNYQVNNWADYINNSGLTAITRNECLGQKKIFRVILSILKFISNPYDNKITAQAYKTLSECGIFKLHLDRIIENFDRIFITLDNDTITEPDLAKFHWDMNYWLSFPELSIEELSMKIGLVYFSDKLEKSNIHLISTLCAKIDKGNFNQTIRKLEDLSEKPSLSGFKFFSEDEEENMTGGKIQIMTLHKSKGDEFDYVFLPELSEKNLTLDINKLTLKRSSDFAEGIKQLSGNYTPKTKNELKEFLISENYRLLYVAITRARKRLYISTAKKEIYFGKEQNSNPNIIFEELLQN